MAYADMKKKVILLLMLLVAIVPAMAQPQQNWQRPQSPQPQNQPQKQGNQQPKFDPQEFIKRMEGYIAIKAGLTKEESDKFFPIYREFKAKQRDLTFKQQRLQREKPANDSEYGNVINQIASLSVQIAKLEQTYFPRMCKVIPAKKVYVAIQAENDFHRDMIRQPLQWGAGMQPQWGPMQGAPGAQRNGNNNRNGANPQWGGNNRQWNGNGMPSQQKKN